MFLSQILTSLHYSTWQIGLKQFFLLVTRNYALWRVVVSCYSHRANSYMGSGWPGPRSLRVHAQGSGRRTSAMGQLWRQDLFQLLDSSKEQLWCLCHLIGKKIFFMTSISERNCIAARWAMLVGSLGRGSARGGSGMATAATNTFPGTDWTTGAGGKLHPCHMLGHSSVPLLLPHASSHGSAVVTSQISCHSSPCPTT